MYIYVYKKQVNDNSHTFDRILSLLFSSTGRLLIDKLILICSA